MSGAPIAELNRGVRSFYDSIQQDEIAKYSADISIVTFGNKIAARQEFTDLLLCSTPPTLQAYGMTPMGEALNKALDMIEARKQTYTRHGMDYYQPWLVVMSDGAPTDSREKLQRAYERANQLSSARKLTMIPIGIGEDAYMPVLKKLSPINKAFKLNGLDFTSFFRWLSQSVSTTSCSSPYDSFTLNLTDVKDWGTLD